MEKPWEHSTISHSTISVHLSRVLDEIGLNKLTVKHRRETALFGEQIDTSFKETLYKVSAHIFGSQSEGTTIHGLNSDFDSVYCNQNVKVIQDLTEWIEGPKNLLMLQESTAPGYCRLQLMKRDRPEPGDEPPTQDYMYDERNRVVLKNTSAAQFYDRFKGFTQEGPSLKWSCIHSPGGVDYDTVFAYMCTSRLNATEEWASRKRRNGWPTTYLVEQVVNEPTFLVPVGYKLSSNKNIEWRISTSMAERCLMFSLNIVQIKCYVILKILMKTYVTSPVEKSISSYHCKTALLYCMENTDADFWRENNLLQSITRCLKMLHAWVTRGFCPHFIIADSNLFAGKVTSDNKVHLRSVLQRLIQSTVYSLLAVSIDGLGQKLEIKLGTKPNTSPILDFLQPNESLGLFESGRQRVTNCCILMLLDWTQDSAIMKVRDAITLLESKTNFKYTIKQSATENAIKYLKYTIKQNATENAIKYLSGLLGSMIASSSLSRRERIPKCAIDLVETSATYATYDISSLIKQASVLYCCNELGKVVQLCIKIFTHLTGTIVYPVCNCFVHEDDTYIPKKYQPMSSRRHEISYTSCVQFIPHEIYCVPHALRYELFKTVGDDKHKFLAVVDCLPLLTYIVYITYRTLGEEELGTQHLHYLEQCIIEGKHPLCHRETAWNILGQCYELENQPNVALDCYRKSLDIRPRNNAAKWLLPLLLYKSHTCTSV